jgi:hypothetical protein
MCSFAGMVRQPLEGHPIATLLRSAFSPSLFSLAPSRCCDPSSPVLHQFCTPPRNHPFSPPTTRHETAGPQRS